MNNLCAICKKSTCNRVDFFMRQSGIIRSPGKLKFSDDGTYRCDLMQNDESLRQDRQKFNILMGAFFNRKTGIIVDSIR